MVGASPAGNGWWVETGRRKDEMTHHHQKGYLFHSHGSWYVRVRQPEMKAGEVVWKQVAKRIASMDECPTKKQAAVLRDEYILGFNRGLKALEPTVNVNKLSLTVDRRITLEAFATKHYLPFAKREKRVSTYQGYKQIWEKRLRPRIGEMRVADFRPHHGNNLLEQIATTKPDLTHNSMKRIKDCLGAMFAYAVAKGVVESNPMHGRGVIRLPKGHEGKPTSECDLETTLKTINVLAALPNPLAVAAVAVAAYAGLREGEIRGLEWQDYTGELIFVRRSIWGGNVVNPPKTKNSAAPVPVIKPLKEVLDTYRAYLGNPLVGRVFLGFRAESICLDNIVRNYVRPALQRAGIEWHGWHAFRRGLGTNLRRLGIREEVVQRILRHSRVDVTMNHYVKVHQPDLLAAMKLLESAISGKNVQQRALTAPTVQPVN
jgi:integrase